MENQGTLYDRYNAACSWALANQPDSSFVQLFKITEIGKYKDLKYITSDSDLNSLHTDERWDQVIGIVKSNRGNLDESLVSMLDTILQEDQKYRLQIEEIEKKYGWDSEETKAYWKIITEKDSINLSKIKNILDHRGWLGSDIETQEKYLPMMREAVKKGDAQEMI